MIDALTTLLSSPMMQRSLLAALIVGLTAPIIGTYLVHRRLAMLGDGIGHISLTPEQSSSPCWAPSQSSWCVRAVAHPATLPWPCCSTAASPAASS